MNFLTQRKKLILNAVITEYIANAEPISSSRIVEKYCTNVSSATVRNELFELEEHGYLSHPHTSAGRVPTDKGYRLYVDYLLNNKQALSDIGVTSINGLYRLLNKEMENLLTETSIVLSKITNYATLLMIPHHKESIVKRVDLIRLSKFHLLIVVIMTEGNILKQYIETTSAIKPSDLRKIEVYINKHCIGAKGHELQGKALDCLEEIKSSFKSDLLEKIASALALKRKEKIIVEGALQLLSQPEFLIRDRIKELFDLLNENIHLAHLLHETSKNQGLTIKIGAEFSHSFSELSFVGKTFNSKSGSVGTIGILGPTRMDYARTIPTIDYIASTLTQVLSKG